MSFIKNIIFYAKLKGLFQFDMAPLNIKEIEQELKFKDGFLFWIKSSSIPNSFVLCYLDMLRDPEYRKSKTFTYIIKNQPAYIREQKVVIEWNEKTGEYFISLFGMQFNNPDKFYDWLYNKFHDHLLTNFNQMQIVQIINPSKKDTNLIGISEKLPLKRKASEISTAEQKIETKTISTPKNNPVPKNVAKFGDTIVDEKSNLYYLKTSQTPQNYKLVDEKDLKVLIAKMKSKQIRLEFLKKKKTEQSQQQSIVNS